MRRIIILGLFLVFVLAMLISCTSLEKRVVEKTAAVAEEAEINENLEDFNDLDALPDDINNATFDELENLGFE